MLVLCLGLRRGEVLGLTWKSVDFETGEIYVDHQIQRAGRQILHRETKTEESDDFLPVPALCLKALRMRRARQVGDRKAAGELRQGSHDLIFTTKYGTPIEPGDLTRMFALRARRAGVRVIPLRNTRHTCSSLLVALKVHPKRCAPRSASCPTPWAVETQEAPDLSGASHLCALGRIRTCNLLIRSQMLYPLSYECLFCFPSSLSALPARSRRQEEHYMTAAVM